MGTGLLFYILTQELSLSVLISADTRWLFNNDFCTTSPMELLLTELISADMVHKHACNNNDFRTTNPLIPKMHGLQHCFRSISHATPDTLIDRYTV